MYAECTKLNSITVSPKDVEKKTVLKIPITRVSQGTGDGMLHTRYMFQSNTTIY
jgi:hypothetical protein